VQLLGSDTILREVIAAADLLADDWGVASDIWSVPSFTELRRDAMRSRPNAGTCCTRPKRRARAMSRSA
jgi:pyruvate dehydrogenase complex dehydrogenase (E1) component